MADFQIERKFFRQGLTAIAGIDEVGRGALFGPVVAAAVIVPAKVIKKNHPQWVKEIRDSKLLTPLNRRRLAAMILAEATSIGIGVASNQEIDQKNIYWASLEAMKRAVQNLSLTPDILLVDGFILKDVNYLQKGIPQGDRRCVSIAAASIVAKVLRDEMMVLLDKIFEGFGLSRNKGYGTREHYRALAELGPTPFHRRTFNLKLKS
jgi:ribonuclease HII